MFKSYFNREQALESYCDRWPKEKSNVSAEEITKYETKIIHSKKEHFCKTYQTQKQVVFDINISVRSLLCSFFWKRYKWRHSLGNFIPTFKLFHCLFIVVFFSPCAYCAVVTIFFVNMMQHYCAFVLVSFWKCRSNDHTHLKRI